MKSDWRYVEGGAFYYVLFVALLCSLLSIILLSAASLFSQHESRIANKANVLINYQSARNWLLLDPPCAMGQTAEVDLFGEGDDRAVLNRHRWGMFEVGTAMTYSGPDTIKRSFFVGQCIAGSERIALYLEDHNRPLSLCGKTRLEGTCYVPKAGVKRAYIEGQTYQGDELIYGTGKTATESMPAIDPDSALEAVYRPLDSANSTATFAEESSILRASFAGEPLVVESTSGVIGNVDWRGQVMIVSQQMLIVSAEAQLEDVILLAPVIRIQSGFRGSGQLYATDSLIIEPDAELSYPSIVMLRKHRLDGEAVLDIGSHSKVNGVVALWNSTQSARSRGVLSIDENARVEGLVYTNESLDHRGTVIGSVYTKRFLLRTPSSVYENHLLNAEISATDQHSMYNLPIFFAEQGKRNLVKWL